VFIVQSVQEFFDIVDQLLELSGPFQARILIVRYYLKTAPRAVCCTDGARHKCRRLALTRGTA
jgi:hypothetical protein